MLKNTGLVILTILILNWTEPGEAFSFPSDSGQYNLGKALALPSGANVAKPKIDYFDLEKADDVLCEIGKTCEAEVSKMSGPTLGSAISGFSGKGYASGFTNASDKIEFTLLAGAAGRYAIEIGYACPSGTKTANLVVNGSGKPILLDSSQNSWKTRAVDTISLILGTNIVGISANWTYFNIDYIKLTPAGAPVAFLKPPKLLANVSASAQTKSLHAWLVENYGVTTLSGQQDIAEANYVFSRTGKRPAIQAGDFMRYSPSFYNSPGRDKKPIDGSEQYLDSAKSGYLISMMWHWIAPTDLVDGSGELAWYKGFYTKATTFDLGAVLLDTNRAKYKLMLADMDSIALQLKKFADADIPILWRPLHEAEGKWFWWGAKGPENFKQLWRLMYHRYTKLHRLNNLVWVYTSGGLKDWYPGDDVVDIVGYDGYTANVKDPLVGIWDDLKCQFNGKKLLALTEFGGVPDIGGMKGYGVTWSYFVSWSGDCCGPKKMTDAENVAIYGNPLVKNRSEINTQAIYATPISLRKPNPLNGVSLPLIHFQWDILGRHWLP